MKNLTCLLFIGWADTSGDDIWGGFSSETDCNVEFLKINYINIEVYDTHYLHQFFEFKGKKVLEYHDVSKQLGQEALTNSPCEENLRKKSWLRKLPRFISSWM